MGYVFLAIRVVAIFRCLQCVFNTNLALVPTVTEPPHKWGVHHLKIDWGILDEAKMHKHTYETYKDMIKVEIKVLQHCLKITR
jgi:hypothetical protein